MKTVTAQDEHRSDQSVFQESRNSVPNPSSPQNHLAGDVCAFLGKGVHFKGTITYQGTMRIDGSFDGEIRTDGVVLVGEGAELIANVTAGTIVSKGTICGDIRAKEKLILRAHSVIVGDITAPALAMEEGAQVDGKLQMGQGTREVKQGTPLRPLGSSEQPSGMQMAV